MKGGKGKTESERKLFISSAMLYSSAAVEKVTQLGTPRDTSVEGFAGFLKYKNIYNSIVSPMIGISPPISSLLNIHTIYTKSKHVGGKRLRGFIFQSNSNLHHPLFSTYL